MSTITRVRTSRIPERPNLIWVEIETEAVIHEQIAPWLIGRDSRKIEAISRHCLTPYLGFHSASAEIRAASAIDLAL